MNQLKNYRSRKILIKRIIFWVLIFVGLLVLFFAQTRSYAASLPARADPCIVFGCVSDIPTNSANYQGSDGVVRVVITIVGYLVYVAVGLTVLFIVIGAYRMLTSNGNDGEFKKGKETVVNAIIGLVIAIASGAIVYVISQLVTGLNIFS